jgi:hypothetical protein
MSLREICTGKAQRYFAADLVCLRRSWMMPKGFFSFMHDGPSGHAHEPDAVRQRRRFPLPTPPKKLKLPGNEGIRRRAFSSAYSCRRTCAAAVLRTADLAQVLTVLTGLGER